MLVSNNNFNINLISDFHLFKYRQKYLLYPNSIFLGSFYKGNILFIESFSLENKIIRKYFFLGVCIAIKKKKLNCCFILRNVIGTVMVEQQFLIFNNLLLNIRKSIKRNTEFRKSKLFFLKNLPFFFRINKLVLNETFFYSNKKLKIKYKKQRKPWKFF